MTYSAMYGGRSGRAKGKAPKSKKLKCPLCHAKGHDATNCPQIPAHNDNHDEQKEQILKATLMQPTLGFGKTHKTSRKAGTILTLGTNTTNSHHHTEDGPESATSDPQYIFDFFRKDDHSKDNYDLESSTSSSSSLIILDGGCDIGATVDHIATTLTNSNLKKAKLTYQKTMSAFGTATSYNNDTTTTTETSPSLLHTVAGTTECPIPYGASICRFFIKPTDHGKSLVGHPRMTTILETNPHTYFVLGLGPGFFMNNNTPEEEEETTSDGANTRMEQKSDDYQEAFQALSTAISDHVHDDDDNNNNTNNNNPNAKMTDHIVGLYGKLDYSPEMTDMMGYDTATQLHKLRVTCRVAIQYQLPIQVKIHPSAVPLDDNDDDKEDDTRIQQMEAYKHVVKDLARVLLEMMTPTSTAATTIEGPLPLRVHLSSWSGTELHMNHLLQAFPQNLYFGLNATIGYTKHKHLHECAFALPLDRCILESDAPNAIPSQLHHQKKVFCHSGCILYTAVSVAEHKRHTVSPTDVLRIATQNTMQLYGGPCRSSSSGGDDGDGGPNSTVTNGLSRRVDEVLEHAKRQRNEQRRRQLPPTNDDNNNNNNNNNLDDKDDEGLIYPATTTNIRSDNHPIKSKKKVKTTKRTGNNVVAHNNNDKEDDSDDMLLAELVNDMMTTTTNF